jgi:anti-sigma-K factor RskA
MPTLNEEQYERVARWLDGEKVKLTPPEQDATEEICRAEADLASALDAASRQASMDRARRRLAAALARPQLRLWRIGALAAAAAAVVLAAVLWHPTGQPPATAPQLTPQVQRGQADGAYLAALEYFAADDELDIVKHDLDDLAADLALAAAPRAIDLKMEAIEKDIDEFLFEDTPAYPAEG